MKTVYKSKIDTWLGGILGGVPVAILWSFHIKRPQRESNPCRRRERAVS